MRKLVSKVVIAIEKVYVTVRCVSSLGGVVLPREIKWKDERTWQIERILHTCRSPDLSFEGIRYTVLIGGEDKYLYRDRHDWYVYTA